MFAGRAVSVLGAAVLAAASWAVGAVPVGWSPAYRPALMAAYYAGLAAVVGAWLLLGRRLLAGDRRTARALTGYALATAAPLLAAAPLGRDLWAYAAQGHLVGTGRDPYTAGPVAAPGAFAEQVSPRWASTPAPYGPVWLRLSQAAAWAAHGHPLVAALLLRLPAFAGLALCCWAITALAGRIGVDPALPLWLGAANPLMIVLGVGGGHNDLPMLGLALSGLAVAAARHRGAGTLAGGAVMAAVAALVKSPAVVVAAFAVPAWLAGRPAVVPRRVVAGATALAAGAAAATAAVLTAAAGLGFGWMTQVNKDAPWVSWLSLPTGAAMLGKWLAGDPSPRGLDGAIRAARTVGELLAVVVLVVLWLAAVRRSRGAAPARPRLSLGPVAAALAVAALFAPSVQPWYYLWAIALAGLALTRPPALVAVAAVPVAGTALIEPSGYGLESGPWAPLVVAAAVGLTAGALAGRRRVPARAAQSRASAL